MPEEKKLQKNDEGFGNKVSKPFRSPKTSKSLEKAELSKKLSKNENGLEKSQISKKERIDSLLQELVASGDVEGAAVVTRDGLLVTSSLSSKVDAETLAAMTATMMGSAETAMHELKKKELERVIVETRDSKLITMGAGEETILVAMVSEKVNLGLILISMKKIAQKIEKEVE